MTTGIVNKLIAWVRGHAADLERQGIRIEEQFPDDNSLAPWKSTVGFVFNDVVVTYTVWERTILQTSLVVVNSKTKRTVFFKDSEPEAADIVDSDLPDVVRKLTSGDYSRMSSSA
jgi:hypothetical protein